jgi:carbon-monoxide dehydrogenase medium subunit
MVKRLRDFDYHEPETLQAAVSLLAAAGSDARVLAGGTDLIVDLKTERLRAQTVVNIKRISGIEGVGEATGGTRIGALTKVTAVEQSSTIRSSYPGLAEAASILAAPPVRALATIGGNVGRASPASDLGPALIVHGAVAEIVGIDGVRRVLVEDLYVGPGETTLTGSDIITSFFLPEPPDRFGSAHIKLGKRGSGTDIAIAAVSTALAIGPAGVVADCKVALASLGPKPLRSPAVESALVGTKAGDDDLKRAAAAVRDDISPIGDVRATAAYRSQIAEVLTSRALLQARQMALEEGKT